jgi:hypothetical protein
MTLKPRPVYTAEFKAQAIELLALGTGRGFPQGAKEGQDEPLKKAFGGGQ